MLIGVEGVHCCGDATCISLKCCSLRKHQTWLLFGEFWSATFRDCIEPHPLAFSKYNSSGQEHLVIVILYPGGFRLEKIQEKL